MLAAIVLLALPVLPVMAAAYWLGPQLLGLLQFAFSVFVLLFAFGPRDLKDEVDDYVAALERHDRDEALRRGKELLESSPSGYGLGARAAVEEAIFIQANNRIFGVIFWFMVLGAGGAWAYRVSDMLRRRVRIRGRAAGAEARAPGSRQRARVPARSAGVGARATHGAGLRARRQLRGRGRQLALGGRPRRRGRVLDRAEDLLARVGKGSLQPSLATSRRSTSTWRPRAAPGASCSARCGSGSRRSPCWSSPAPPSEHACRPCNGCACRDAGGRRPCCCSRRSWHQASRPLLRRCA